MGNAIARDYSLLRSWLFVPGDSQRKLEKCWSSGADALIVDLEDAVSAAQKQVARTIARDAIAAANRGRTLVSIRVNALDTGLTFADLDAVMPCLPDCIVLPKVMAADDVRAVSAHIAGLEKDHGLEPGSVRILAIVTEHPRAVMNLNALCTADPRTAAVMWGSEDLGAAVGARRVKDESGRLLPVFALVRSLALLAASAAGLACLDTPVVELDALEAVSRESTEAAAMGFAGKVAIHPSQVEPINRAFLPSSAELEHARALLEAHAAASDGAFRFGGKMIDMPHVRIARRLVALGIAHGAA